MRGQRKLNQLASCDLLLGSEQEWRNAQQPLAHKTCNTKVNLVPNQALGAAAASWEGPLAFFMASVDDK